MPAKRHTVNKAVGADIAREVALLAIKGQTPRVIRQTLGISQVDVFQAMAQALQQMNPDLVEESFLKNKRAQKAIQSAQETAPLPSVVPDDESVALKRNIQLGALRATCKSLDILNNVFDSILSGKRKAKDYAIDRLVRVAIEAYRQVRDDVGDENTGTIVELFRRKLAKMNQVAIQADKSLPPGKA